MSPRSSHLAPDHRSRQGAHIGAGRGPRLDHPAIAHDREIVGGGHQLADLVAHERHRLAFHLDDGAEGVEQELRLDRREHRGRLVEHEHLGIAPQAFDDLDPLAHADREVADAGVGIDLESVLLADLGDAGSQVAWDQPPDVAEGDVLPHRECLDEREVLVHHPDPVLGSGDRILDLDRDAGAPDLSGIGDDEADQDLHQRRLAGTVLTQHAVDTATVEGEVDIGACRDRAVALGDADQLDRRRGAGLPAGDGAVVGHGRVVMSDGSRMVAAFDQPAA